VTVHRAHGFILGNGHLIEFGGMEVAQEILEDAVEAGTLKDIKSVEARVNSHRQISTRDKASPNLKLPNI
jgi:hypothetical protein